MGINNDKIEYRELEEILKSITELSSSNITEDRGENMKDETFDTLFKEIKDDMREREARTRKEIIEREQRFEKLILSHLEEAKERETRYFNDSKEREERLTEINK